MQLQTGEITGQIAIGRSPVADHAGHRLYVAEREEAAIGIINADTFTHVATLAVGLSPFALTIAPDDSRLYMANVRGNTISVIDTKALAVIATIDAGISPYGLSVTPDGRQLLVSNQQVGTLTVVDTKNFDKIAIIKVGRDPEGFVLATQLKKAYVMNWFSGEKLNRGFDFSIVGWHTLLLQQNRNATAACSRVSHSFWNQRFQMFTPMFRSAHFVSLSPPATLLKTYHRRRGARAPQRTLGPLRGPQSTR